MKKRGRKPVTGTPRTTKVQIRLTQSEYYRLVYAANAAKTNVSDFCRSAALEAAKKTTS